MAPYRQSMGNDCFQITFGWRTAHQFCYEFISLLLKSSVGVHSYMFSLSPPPHTHIFSFCVKCTSRIFTPHTDMSKFNLQPNDRAICFVNEQDGPSVWRNTNVCHRLKRACMRKKAGWDFNSDCCGFANTLERPPHISFL